MERSMSLGFGDKNSVFRTSLRSAFLGSVFSICLVLIFALVIKLTGVGGNAIGIVNQIIKFVSVFLGILFGVKDGSKWFFKGILGGTLFAIITFLIFSAIGSEFNFGNMIIDIVLCSLVGLVSALISAGKK